VSYWIKGALAALLLFISVALHELAHSFVSLHYRIPIIGITLFIFGGVSQMKGEPQTPKEEFRIAIAGPLSSFLLSGIFFLLSTTTASPGIKALYAYVARLNLMLGIFNLIPGFPMDGGRVLRSIIWRRKNDFLYATRKASGFGQKIALFFIFSGLLSVFVGFPGGIWMMLIGWFLFTAAQASYQQVSLQEALAGVRVRDVMVRDIVTISASTTLAEAVDRFFLRYGYGGFPVFDGGRLLGMLTLKEVKDVPREDWQKVTVADVLVPHNRKWEVSPESAVMKALEIMISEDQGRLVVTENDKVVGLITRNGIAQYVQVMER
jgi:Zn-dependent protease